MRYVYILVVLALLGERLSAQCTACTPDANLSPRPYGFNPDTLYLPPNKDTTLVIYFTFPDSTRAGGNLLVFPNYAIWVDSLKLDFARITQQNNQPFAYDASDPTNGAINFDQPPRNKQYDPNDPSKRANFVVYQNPGGAQGATPPIGCARICVRTSATGGSDTLRVKVRVFVSSLGDATNKDTTNLTPTLFGTPAWLDTVFRYVVVITSNTPSAPQCTDCTPDANLSPRPYGFNPDTLYLLPNRDTSLVIHFTFPDTVRQGNFLLSPNYAIWVDSLKLDVGLITQQNNQPFAYNASDPTSGAINFDQAPRNKQYDPNDPSKRANFVVYQNPGDAQGATPPFGCARICVKTSPTEGSDTLRVKVRVFVSSLGDAPNKDTTNLTPNLFGIPAWLDTVFRYVVVITNNPPAASLNGKSVATRISLYPNPAYYESHVRFTLSKSGNLTLRAIAADGREVYRHTGTYSAGEHTHTFRLPAGVYVVSVGSGDSWISQRLVVVE